jgi:RHS repeat-associated protein
MVVLAIRGGTDTYVQSVKYEYDDLSRTQAVTSYANPDCTTPVNGVKFTYDAWGNVSKTNQDHAGAADDNDPSVQYAYEDDPTDNKAKYVRLDYVTYPNSRAVNYNYAAGGVGGALSRLENIADDDNGTHKYAAYTYLGAGTIVEIDHPAITTNGLKLTYKGASGGLRYPGFDRFGRTVWQSWKKADDTDLDRYFYGYDRASNRIWEMDYLDYDFSGRHEAYTYDSLNRLVKAVRGTLTAADPQQPGQPSGEIAPVLGDANVDGVIDSTDYALIDNGYAMGLGGWFNGDFDGNGVIDETDCAIIDSYYASQPFTRSVVRTWDWSLDGVGNWAGYREDAGAGGQGNWDLDQLRSHNKANEIDNDDDHADAPDGSISGGGWVLAAYDAAGNMKRGPKPGDESMAGGTRHKYTYDAWNRLVKIETWNWTDTNEDGKVQDGEVQVTGAVAEYRYDPLNRRIRKFTDPSEGNWTVREYYYNNQWQNLEVRKEVKPRSGSPLSEPAVAAVVCEQYIWSPRYIDAPILRDRDADGNSGTGNLGGTGSGLEERHYYTTDGNGNVTALASAAGAAVERYVYDPYGKPTIYNDDWTATVSWANSEQNEILYCGYRFDPESALYHVRNRMYDYSLGRWIIRDPKGYVDGMGLYEYCASHPSNTFDPMGLLEALWVTGPQYVPGESPGNDVAYAGVNYQLSAAEKAQITKGGGQAYVVQMRTTQWAPDGGPPVTETAVYTTQITVRPDSAGVPQVRGDGLAGGVPMTDGSVAATYTCIMMNLNQPDQVTGTPDGNISINKYVDGLRSGPSQTGSVSVNVSTTLVVGDGTSAVTDAKKAAEDNAKQSGVPIERPKDYVEYLHKQGGYSGTVMPKTDGKIAENNVTVKVGWDASGKQTLTSDPGLKSGPSRAGHSKDEYPGAPPKDYKPAEPGDRPKVWKSE